MFSVPKEGILKAEAKRKQAQTSILLRSVSGSSIRSRRISRFHIVSSISSRRGKSQGSISRSFLRWSPAKSSMEAVAPAQMDRCASVL
jgi:hypothetical protein